MGLQASARNGCPLYAMFLHGLPHDAIEQLLQDQLSHKSLVTVSVYEVKQMYWANLEFRRNHSEQEAALKTTVYAFISGKRIQPSQPSWLTAQ